MEVLIPMVSVLIQDVGYMVGNKSDSTIKGVIDTWYQANMLSYTKKLEDAIWCNNRSSRVDRSNTIFGAYDRTVTNINPSLVCSNITR